MHVEKLFKVLVMGSSLLASGCESTEEPDAGGNPGDGALADRDADGESRDAGPANDGTTADGAGTADGVGGWLSW